MKRPSRSVSGVLLGSVVVLASGGAAHADWMGSGQAGGARTSYLDRAELANLAQGKTVAGQADPQPYEYTSVTDCPGSVPGVAGSDNFCPGAATRCAGNTASQGQGPAVKIYRRPVDKTGKSQGGWSLVGTTCFPQLVPGKPSLGMAQILAAFHDTKFAVPTLLIQPKGNVTLVTLPTYFELRWPAQGFQPEEVDRPDPARMLGFAVEIRPTLQSIEYVFGDGSSSGKTTSLGGPYPSGDIVKEYPDPGRLTTRADVTYGGKFRVGGGPWIDIPDTVTVKGTPEPLWVRTAHARLYSNTG